MLSALCSGPGCGARGGHLTAPTPIGVSPVTATEAPPPPDAGLPPVDAGPGRPMKLTMYFVAEQPCPDGSDASLPKCGGGALAAVSTGFRKTAAMQGSARLCDGRVVSVRTVHPLCFAVVEGAPWGKTASGRPARPFRSIAVDPGELTLGHWYFVPELRGLVLPAPATGEVHDGCVRADDVGGGVKGAHIDLFVGRRDAMTALADLHAHGVTLADGATICP